MTKFTRRLEELCMKQSKFLRKGGLCVALVVTRTAREKGLPLHPDSLRTGQGGQVAGLGKAAVQKILQDHGISKVLAEEGGRTSRGSLGLMREYVHVLNSLHDEQSLNLVEVELWWIDRVRQYRISEGRKFHFDTGKSLRTNIEDLLVSARGKPKNVGTNYVGAMLQHLVGAKLDLVLGLGKVNHGGFSVADRSTNRKGDFQVDAMVIHVTTHPTEALVRTCANNLRDGLRPLIVTIADGVAGAIFLLRNFGIEDRVDVLDAGQFLMANVYERSLFQVSDCKLTLSRLIQRYNEIVGSCETDPAIRITLGN